MAVVKKAKIEKKIDEVIPAMIHDNRFQEGEIALVMNFGEYNAVNDFEDELIKKWSNKFVTIKEVNARKSYSKYLGYEYTYVVVDCDGEYESFIDDELIKLQQKEEIEELKDKNKETDRDIAFRKVYEIINEVTKND